MDDIYLQKLKAISTLNPYVKSLSLIKDRLLYDINPLTWRNTKKLKSLKNKYQDEKCIIICNGPSLNAVNFDELQESGVYTIGLNKINLMFNKHSFRPNTIVCVNPFVIEQNLEFFMNTDINLFLDYYGLKRIKKINKAVKRKNIHLLHSTYITGAFAADITKSIAQGFTVTYVAMQVAFHLGFSKVAIIGCDHNFGTKGLSNLTIRQEGTEKNHFIDNYFAPGTQWQLPDLLGSEYHYQLARDVYNVNNRLMVNSTVGGALEIIPRLELRDFYAL